MTTAPPASTQQNLAMLWEIGAIGQLSDAELLAWFLSGRGQAASEAAFETLVARHGPMVLGVCRRVLGDSHAAADAFQATFLILARKASSVRVNSSLGPWLYGVSTRVARKAKAITRAERARVRPIHEYDPPAKADISTQDDLRALIDGEILRLPPRYRSVVVLCYLEGLSQEQAAKRLRCPVGTIQSRLHRARERLRSKLIRRGWDEAAWSAIILARQDVPVTLTKAATSLAERPFAATVPAMVSDIAKSFSRSMLTAKACSIGLAIGALGLSTIGMIPSVSPGIDGENAKARAEIPLQKAQEVPTLAQKLAQILAEHDAQQKKLWAALDRTKSQREQNQVYATMSPDVVAFARRLIALAESSPKDISARDALLWVLDKPGMTDLGPYGDEFARASALLLRYHGNDPEAIRIGLQVDNLVSFHRDTLLLGFQASAQGREAQGLARLALAQYLEKKSMAVVAARKTQGRQKRFLINFVDDDGKVIDKEVKQSDEDYAYTLHLRLCDPEAMHLEAERLFNEVITHFGDVPYITRKHRELEARIRGTSPNSGDEPLTKENRLQVEKLLSQQKTLGEIAEARLDAIHNLAVGKPAPEIIGVDFDGKPLKLSDYRGKVVVLTFWGSWCGPCMREMPHEREMADRLKDKPFALLGINNDHDKQAALKAMKDERITWPNWYDGAPDEGPIASRYHILSYPTIMVLDDQGIIRSRKSLGKSLDKTVDDLLKALEEKTLRK